MKAKIKQLKMVKFTTAMVVELKKSNTQNSKISSNTEWNKTIASGLIW